MWKALWLLRRHCVGPGRWPATLIGRRNITAPTMINLIARDWPLASGRLFEPAELSGAGGRWRWSDRPLRDLVSFGAAWIPFDQIIRVRKVPLTIIGVLDRKGQNSLGQDQDDIVLMPLATARNRVLGQTQGRQRALTRSRSKPPMALT